MASSIALRRSSSALGLLNKLFNPIRTVAVAPSTTRSFNTTAQMCSDYSISRRHVFFPISSLKLMDQFEVKPFLDDSRGMGSRIRATEDKNGVYLKIDMPGLGKENVKVSVKQNTLIIKREDVNEAGDEEVGTWYRTKINLPKKLCKIDQIKAAMKNGVLEVIIPKVKEDEKKDVHQVQVD